MFISYRAERQRGHKVNSELSVPKCVLLIYLKFIWKFMDVEREESA